MVSFVFESHDTAYRIKHLLHRAKKGIQQRTHTQKKLNYLALKEQITFPQEAIWDQKLSCN